MARVQDGTRDWEKVFSYHGWVERDRLTGAGACATPSMINSGLVLITACRAVINRDSREASFIGFKVARRLTQSRAIRLRCPGFPRRPFLASWGGMSAIRPP